MKPKIVHIITGLYTGGAERSLYNLLSGGLARQFDNYVISLLDQGSFGPKLIEIGVPVYSLGMSKGIGALSGMYRLRKITTQLAPDIIQGWMYHGNLAACAAALFRYPRPKVAWNVRQTLYDIHNEKTTTRWAIKLNRLLSENADAIIYNSRVSQDQHEAFGLSAKSPHIIVNGFDLERLSPASQQRKAMRESLGVSEDAIVIGHVARLHPMKDHAGFIRAAVNVMKYNSHVTVLMIGKGIDEKNQLLIDTIPGESRNQFHLLGEREDVYELMQGMDLLCSSSAWGEGFPNVLGEAMALGVPCVATNVGDAIEIVGDTGYIVPAGDVEGLTDALTSLVNMASVDRRRLGSEARERVGRCFSLDSTIENYLALYGELLSTV